MRRRTLAGQVGEAAVFIHRHTGDRRYAIGDPGAEEHLLAVLLSMRAEPLLEAWVAFWEPLLDAAEARGEVRVGLDRRRAGEWIVRSARDLRGDAVDRDRPRRRPRRPRLRGLPHRPRPRRMTPDTEEAPR